LYGEFKDAALAEPLVESVRLVESMCARLPVRGLSSRDRGLGARLPRLIVGLVAC
jgi:hypothetical protein